MSIQQSWKPSHAGYLRASLCDDTTVSGRPLAAQQKPDGVPGAARGTLVRLREMADVLIEKAAGNSDQRTDRVTCRAAYRLPS